MRSVNKVILIGNLTRNPEMRQTSNGQTVTTFCIATNREWVTKDGGKHGLAEYHDIVAWAKLAEICSKYLKKGKLVYIEGYLKTRSWDTPEGVKKFRTEVVAQDMIMLEKRPQGESDIDYIPESDMDFVDHGGDNMENFEEEQTTPAPATTIDEKPREEVQAPAPAPTESFVEEKPEEKATEINTGIDIAGDLGL
ncbi:single-stranded DNA-binding protein [Patescibacteria group bacterium]|nr:single-stranded DNA-binding protein [Patescibacteria group bacterium]